jgi:hypothetical protein
MASEGDHAGELGRVAHGEACSCRCREETHTREWKEDDDTEHTDDLRRAQLQRPFLFLFIYTGIHDPYNALTETRHALRADWPRHPTALERATATTITATR